MCSLLPNLDALTAPQSDEMVSGRCIRGQIERERSERERRESGVLDLSSYTKQNSIITPANIYATLYNFCNRHCWHDPNEQSLLSIDLSPYSGDLRLPESTKKYYELPKPRAAQPPKKYFVSLNSKNKRLTLFSKKRVFLCLSTEDMSLLVQ